MLRKTSLVIIVLIFLKVYCVTAIHDCETGEFECDDGECVESEYVCDGEVDCDDSSDELRCNSETRQQCAKNYFKCKSDNTCIMHSWLCDDEEDCDDGSDEVGCGKSDCHHFEFECLSNEQCLHRSLRCNGKIDCDDGSDEWNCGEYSSYCNNKHFPCEGERNCLKRQFFCDGKDDCDNGSDEKHCVTTSVIQETTEQVSETTTYARSETTEQASETTTYARSETTEQASETIIYEPEITGQYCPENYCTHNVDCVAIDGQYYCICLPEYTGEKCEVRIKDERHFPDLWMVIAVSATFVTLFIIVGTLIFCYCKRKSKGYSTELMSKPESQLPITTYSKEQDKFMILKK